MEDIETTALDQQSTYNRKLMVYTRAVQKQQSRSTSAYNCRKRGRNHIVYKLRIYFLLMLKWKA